MFDDLKMLYAPLGSEWKLCSCGKCGNITIGDEAIALLATFPPEDKSGDFIIPNNIRQIAARFVVEVHNRFPKIMARLSELEMQNQWYKTEEGEYPLEGETVLIDCREVVRPGYWGWEDGDSEEGKKPYHQWMVLDDGEYVPLDMVCIEWRYMPKAPGGKK